MLILLFGPSGVGKSAIANRLVEKHSWVPVISWLTRPERPDELFKVSISPSSFDMLAKHGKLWSDIEQNGHRYGLLGCEVRQAIDDPQQFFVLDYGLSSWQRYFVGVPNLPVYVAAGSDASLTRRLVHAGRPDRLAGALRAQDELEAWSSANRSAVRIVNADDSLERTVAEIEEAARAWASKSKLSN